MRELGDMLKEGLKYTSRMVVDDAHTAAMMGSGDMAVLATPAMLSLMENAAMLAVVDHLPEGATTVGGHIASSHLKPSAVGAEVSATAELTKVEGRKLHFKVVAHEGETLIGEGTHLRFVVDRQKFLSNL